MGGTVGASLVGTAACHLGCARPLLDELARQLYGHQGQRLTGGVSGSGGGDSPGIRHLPPLEAMLGERLVNGGT
jgi:hypothetical protein